MNTSSNKSEKGGVLASIKRAGESVGSLLFSSSQRSSKSRTSKYAPDPDTGKIAVEVSEMDFVATNYSSVLLMERLYAIEPNSQNEVILLDALQNVMSVLRSNPVQRRLVRKKLFYDADLDETGRNADNRVLAGNIKDYFKLVVGTCSLANLAFAELTVELLVVFLLGATTDEHENVPRKLASSNEPSIGKQRAPAKKKYVEFIEEVPVNAEGTATTEELDYVIKSGVCEVLDFVLQETTTLGVEACLYGGCSQTLNWALALYRLLCERDELTLKHAYEQNMVKICWDLVSRKTRMRDPLASRLAQMKTSVLNILLELGSLSIEEMDEKLSINMINVNTRAVKELVKLLHHFPEMHPTILTVLTMVGQKQSNNLMMKELGLMEYLTTKVLPFFSSSHQVCIPHLVILLNSWIITYDDLQFFYQFNGIQCLVFHMKVAASESSQFSDPTSGANWDDMILHGLSILYKLSDSQQYHMKMVTDDCLTVLLECLRVIDPLKSLYHMNSFIAALYSLRNLTTTSVEVRKLVVQNENFVVLCHLLSTPSLPINCLLHLLFLFCTLSKDSIPRGEPDPEYRGLIMNVVFLSIFKPLCKIIQASPVRKLMDDSQLTILCLALQSALSLVQIAKDENPLLCIQIEVELPLDQLKYMANSESRTPFPELANELLGMVYLMP